MESSEWLNQVRGLFRPPYLYRIFIFVIVADLIALVFGFAFLLIVQGLLMGFVRVAFYWQPAYKLLIRVADAHNISPILSRPSIRWWQYITIGINLGLSLVLIVVGIWLLFRTGFCDQNLICMLIADP
jgi:hypothetical protein